MKMKARTDLLFFFLSLMLFSTVNKAEATDLGMTYVQEIKKMESQWQVLHVAYQKEKEGDLNSAILFFRKALLMGDQNVPRNALARLYEKTGQYEKALEQVQWFLKGDQNEQGRQASLADKQRLSRKIEARETGDSHLKGDRHPT